MIKLLYLQSEKLDSLLEQVQSISKHTDAWGDNLSYFLTSLTVLASLATIFGLLGLLYEFKKDSKKHTISLDLQKLIVQDLIRHIFVNAAIMEVVRIKMAGNWGKFHPVEGTFSKFCFLDTDLQLDRIKIKDCFYKKQHNLSFLLRNYNIHSTLLEKHFNDPLYNSEEIKKELDELWNRTEEISKDFIELCEVTKLGITTISIHDYIEEHYEEQAKKRKKPLPVIDIPDRTGNRDYFDIEFNLGERFNYCIRAKFDDVRVIPFLP